MPGLHLRVQQVPLAWPDCVLPVVLLDGSSIDLAELLAEPYALNMANCGAGSGHTRKAGVSERYPQALVQRDTHRE